MRLGYTVVFGAWQGDLRPGDRGLLLDLPVARRGAEPLRGLTTAEFIVEEPTASLPLSRWSSTRSYPVNERGTHTARLTRRRYPHSTPEELPTAGTCRRPWRTALAAAHRLLVGHGSDGGLAEGHAGLGEVLDDKDVGHQVGDARRRVVIAAPFLVALVAQWARRSL
ncbi:hypothetical protein GQF42_02555 [Streptomyces broussonetiae]|uniref:Uncharacterized protein n=1 Tax=Streptomyces broussonetiae TaxID=2686304 RepID=A0A6I6MS93_9ACTN|nr:hypothetical protein [Streptomyces broussonetiae]QHA02332.1 hypothetical protein GQF42_02555 [Streptomyces broussonetiae]